MTTLFDTEATEKPMTTDLVEHKAADLTPLMILQSAVEHGTSADELEKLMNMQERWERNQAQKAYAAAMHACQEKMPKVVKGSQNKQSGNWYADLESVQEVARPIYSSFGFSLCFGEADCPLEKHKRTICDVTHSGGHMRQYHIDLPVDGVGGAGNAIKGMNPVQGCISTTSYGQRRLTCMIFNITITDEDDDGQSYATISQEQIDTLNQWIESTNSDLPRFLVWLGIDRLSDLSAEQFPKALHQLKRKAGAK